MENKVEENKGEAEAGEFDLITRFIKGQKDIDSIYKKAKIFDIIFSLGTSIFVSVVIIGLFFGWRLKIEIFFLVFLIGLHIIKIILDYRQYKIMLRLISSERKILDIENR